MIAVLLILGATVLPPAQAQPTPTVLAPAVSGLPDFTELVERVGPAVVNIRTTERRAARGAARPEMDEEMQEFFRRFFGTPPGEMPGPQQPGPRRGVPREGQQPEEEQQRGVGSGFIFTHDGFVMTNAHVVAGADEVYVTLTDKREFKAKLIGADRRTDVAVVKIEAESLPYVRIGDVSQLKVGEWVMAIGSPFGLDNTVTAGIVSAKARDTGEFVSFIQTDVAINPGNSGGPLINLRGEVVGINSQILSRSGGFMGVSFAIPMDEATRVADQLRATGRVVRGRIGVQIGEVTKDVAESLGLGRAAGALVRSVEVGGPAEKGGVEAGDIITGFDGKSVEKSSDLPRMVGGTKPGSRSAVQVLRRGSARDLTVMVAEIEPESSRVAALPESKPTPAPSAVAGAMGLVLANLGEDAKRELKLKGGVRVEAVDGAAQRAGLREGDVILAVANAEVFDVKQFEAVLAKIDKTKPVNVLFRRGEWAQYALIRPVK
ncbi:Do family serine endopeptidase [Methylibium sp.]|uniref:Do family serine endopeptidase n=1 Tax=Methylibium sp. TaxID=2067992 RepID=UPI0017E31086|nr:Do family serine endopeptidase [Methylibium sp.]MBA3589527.1 Do family serine endopeptidase [Methylibium sp.]